MKPEGPLLRSRGLLKGRALLKGGGPFLAVVLALAPVASGAEPPPGGQPLHEPARIATLSVEESIRLALERAEAVQSAEEALRSAEATAAQTAAGFGPQWSAGAQVGTGSRDDASAGASLSGRGELAPGLAWSISLDSGDTTTSGSAALTLSIWPPASDSTERRRLSEQRLAVEQAKRALEQTRGNMAIAVIEAYHRVQLAEARLELETEALAAARRAFARLQSHAELGHASTLELLEAEIDVMEAENRHFERVESLRAATEAWLRLLGASGNEAYRVEPLALAGPTGADMDSLPPIPPFEEAFRRALEASPVIASRRASVDAAIRTLTAAERDRGLAVAARADSAWHDGSPSEWGLFLEAEYDVYDGGQAARRVESAEHDLEAARLALASAENDLREDVRAALATLEAASRTLDLRRAVERLRRRERDIARIQAADGLITPDDLAERDRAYRAAVLDRVESEFGLYTDHLRLLALTGDHTAWERSQEDG